MRFLVFAPLIGVAACATTAPTTPLRCDAGPAEAFVGQQATQNVGAQMLKATGASTIRWVRFGAMVTMEFREGRLTVRLDPKGKVAGSSCT